MSKIHQVSDEFWVDDYISKLDPIERYLFLYFLTNPHANIAGVYQVTLKIMAAETGLDGDMIQKIVSRFTQDKKAFYVDGWLCMINRRKFNKQDNPSIKAGTERLIKTVPEHIRKLMYEMEQDTVSDGVRGCQRVSEGVRPCPKSDRIRSDKISLGSTEPEPTPPENGFKESLDKLIEAYWICNPVWCGNAGRLGTAREEFHQQLLKGYTFDAVLRAVQGAPQGSKPWEVFKGTKWQEPPRPKNVLRPEADWDEEKYFDKTLGCWVCLNKDGLGMQCVVNEDYVPHRRGQPIVPYVVKL